MNRIGISQSKAASLGSSSIRNEQLQEQAVLATKKAAASRVDIRMQCFWVRSVRTHPTAKARPAAGLGGGNSIGNR